MSEEYTFPAYHEEIEKVIRKFGGEKMETYKGKDITPLWDLKGKGLPWSYKYLYKAPKLEKIAIGVQSFRDKLMSYMTIIWPEDDYALPIFSSFWAESEKGGFFIIDFYPTADCICDIPYLEQYMDPLEDIYYKGMSYFPPEAPGRNNPSWFRVLTSPFVITAEFAPSTKELQNRVLELTTGYLDIYHSLWEKDQPRDADYMKALNKRKDAIRINFREKDPGGIMIEKAVGKEIAELSLEALF